MATASPAYWFCNTDEAEPVGKGAYKKMIEQSCIAAWGNCGELGAELTLQKPVKGDKVFLFCAGKGIVAGGQVTDTQPFSSNSVFNEKRSGEFHRPIEKLKVLKKPLSVADIKNATGYVLPYRHIVCRISDHSAVKFILEHLDADNSFSAVTVKVQVEGRACGAGFGDPVKNRKVEKASVRHVRKLFEGRGYNVVTREPECLGYDLDACKGADELHVEVKGVSGTIPNFLITQNEVRRSKSDPSFRLVVVTNALQRNPTADEFTGKEFLAKYNLAGMVFMARRKT